MKLKELWLIPWAFMVITQIVMMVIGSNDNLWVANLLMWMFAILYILTPSD